MDQNDFFCYNNCMEQPTQPINQPNRRNSFLIRFLFIGFLIIFMIGSAAISVLRNDLFQFNQVQVFGVETFPVNDIESFTKDYLAGYRNVVIPKSSTLLFSKNNFETALLNKFSIIEMAYITFPQTNTINIHIKEKKPLAIWCFTATSCGFIDRNGLVYGQAPNFSEGVYPVFSSESDKTFNEFYGKQVIQPDVMNRYITLVTQLQSDDIRIAETTFLDNGDITFSIEKLFGNYPTDRAQLLGTMIQNDSMFVRDMVTGLSNKVFKEQYISSPKSLEYIDLRFAGKVFYKFKGNEKSAEKNREHQ
jgi:cell division septal protein FtsQ